MAASPGDLLFAKALLCAVSVVKGDRVHGGATTSRVQREIRVFLWLSMSVYSGALRAGSMAFEATLWQNLDQLYAK